MKMYTSMSLKYENVYILLDIGNKAGQLVSRSTPPFSSIRLPLQIILDHIIPDNKD